ncbi:Signal transduction histidine kinase [Halorientalis persicus]|jgi:two-component system OmpR family sensor kinase|uniref:histidine kinase n=1 Tax=Halorientalis persicus TaxID=1367881 RepID=A0A1H8NH97_9EURY|nr:HAMP domain-containing sensor histidine kinase [Halorientalis persicus]SEO28957.1 Signal transduction histidine kinase [Halorientalis persicus]
MMDDPERRRAIRLGVASLAAVSMVLLATNVVLMLSADVAEVTFAFWLIAPAAIVGLLTAVAVWVRADRDRATYLTRVAVWAFLGAVALGVGGALNGYLNAVEGVGMGSVVELFVGWAAGGLLDGGLIGLYDAERRLERERTEAAREEAEQLAAGLSVVNRVLRHDLRNHATVLEGQVDALDAEGEGVDTIRRHVDRIVELAEQGRQMESVLRTDDRIVTDASEVVERVTEDLDTVHANASITVTTPESAPVTVGRMFEVAVENVVENAIVHNDSPEPTVDVTVTNGDDTVTVAVRDDGPGIPEHELDMRELPAESALEHSNGLGLWLVDWFVERSDGDLDIETDGDGSLVRMVLPRA